MSFSKHLCPSVFICGLILALSVLSAEAPDPQANLEKDVTQGALRVVQKDGAVVECPLKHTDVQAEISGFIARVRVTQTFYNPTDEKIEAVYVFPLPHESAVDEMTMTTSGRQIVGVIKRRAEARAIYEQALRAGQTAALLEQERPNIFTQSVANIKPKAEVKIEISYVDVLKYDQGAYEFHFPMVVGPRYNPAGFSGGIGAVPTGQERASGQQKEIAYLKPGERNGHDITLSVKLDAGVPIQDLRSVLHEAGISRKGDSKAVAALSPAGTIPNKDFILKYRVMGKKPEMAVLSSTLSTSGYFMLMVQPKEDEKLAKEPPREIVFLMDISGSQMGWPIEKSKEAMREFLSLMREKDTVQVITFASQSQKLFDHAVPVTKENIDKAMAFSQQQMGGGGTEMLKGVRAAIDDPLDKERMRIVVMFTDGFIGNEAQILEAVGKGCGDRIRFWCLGAGNSINRFLVDGVARQGGGMSKILTLNQPAAPIVNECMERIQRAQLAKVNIDWAGMKVSDVYPQRIPELWSGRPIILYGMYDLTTAGKPVTLKISGEIEGEPVSWPLEVNFPTAAQDNAALANVWARQKIESLMQQVYYGTSPEVEEEVTNIALDYRLMSQYTSFVAVDQADVPNVSASARPPRRIAVPVPMPEGVSFDGNFGGAFDDDKPAFEGSPRALSKARGVDAAGRFKSIERLRSGLSAGDKSKDVDRRLGAAYGPNAPKPGSAGGGWGGGGGMYSNGVLHQGLTQNMLKLQSTSGLAPAATAAAPVTPAPAPREATRAAKKEIANEELADITAREWQAAAQQDRQDLSKRLPDGVKAAEELRKAGKLLEARAKWSHIYLLDSSLTNAGWSAGQNAAQAQAQIEEINAELLKEWRKAQPALDKKLDMVLRDKPLSEALDAIAQAAGFKTRLLEGSLDDACALALRKELRISYLDLRNATAAQALDWLLTPAGLRWQCGTGAPAGGSAGVPARDVFVCSDRRNPELETAWVYDVSRIALPNADEITEKDYQKQAEALRKLTDAFVESIRKALDLPAESTAWFGPGQLLISAKADKHAAAAKLFTSLADAKAEVPDALKELQKSTSARAEKRKDNAAKLIELREKQSAAQKLQEFGWPLLAAGSLGKTHDEALTELSIAWKSPSMAEVAKLDPLDTLRSFWISQQVVPASAPAGVRGLAADEKLARAAAEAALGELEKQSENPQLWYAVAYAALAFRNDADFVAKATAALSKINAEQSLLTTQQKFVTALLAKQPDAKAVTELFKKRNDSPAALQRRMSEVLQGPDAVLLAALTCRKAGGEAWKTFREDQRSLLSAQPLPGSLIIFVNSLERSTLPILRGE
ncbi:MAG TPA: VIT domain-containing protein [Planctomycetota bacterium]